MTILCATDLSETSPAVIQTAARLSRLLNAELELFHALSLPTTCPPDLVDEPFVTGLQAASQASLGAQAALARAAGATVTTHLQIGGADAILDRASQARPELLVVGTHARRGVSRALLGSVAERVLRRSPCPVLVVPPGASSSSLNTSGRRDRLKVVVGVDFSPASDAALAWMASLRSRIDCDVQLVHLYEPANEHDRLGFPAPIPFEVNAELVEVLARELRPRVHAATGADFPLRIRPFWGRVGDPLAWEAETDDADLLIIGTSQARHSTAVQTLRGAHVPVVCVPRHETVPAARPLAPIKTILVPTDFSPGASAAVREAYRLLLGAGGDLVLAHVATPDGVGLEPSRQEEIETCLLALVPADLQAPHIRVRTLVMAGAAPGEAIVKAGRRSGADLVVMSAVGRSGRRGGHGMVTDHVVWNATQPVVVVPCSAAP